MLTDVMHMLSAIHWVPEDQITLFTTDGLIQIGGSLVPRQFPADVCYLSSCNLKYCSYHASNEDFLFSLFLKFKLNLHHFRWLSFYVLNYWFSELFIKKKMILRGVLDLLCSFYSNFDAKIDRNLLSRINIIFHDNKDQKPRIGTDSRPFSA